MRKFIVSAITITCFSSFLAQEITYDVGFETYFDNREYSLVEIARSNSGTDFAARLAPIVGIGFAEKSSLQFGVDAVQLFGVDGEGLFTDLNLLLYYGYDSDKWSASAGLFPRNRMSIDTYSTAFYRDDYLFYDDIVTGVMGRYGSEDSFFEFVCDWEGQPATSREQFRLLSASRYAISKFYAGYNFSLTHFAGQDEGYSNVVDNSLVNPYIGYKVSGLFDFDLKVSLLQSLQRDRSYDNVWLLPRMGEFAFVISRWGFSFDERFYVGDDLFPLYDGHILDDGTYMEYGEQLYTGDIFFRTTTGFYNRASLGFTKSFYDDKLAVQVLFVTHCDGSGFATEQLFKLSLNLDGTLYKGGAKKR